MPAKSSSNVMTSDSVTHGMRLLARIIAVKILGDSQPVTRHSHADEYAEPLTEMARNKEIIG